MSASLAWPLVAFALTLGAIAWLLRTGWAACLALDVPVSRSLHSRAVPRSGGLVVLVAVVVCSWAASGAMTWLLALSLLLGLLSWIDDRGHVPIPLRIAVHLACAGTANGLMLSGMHWSAVLLLTLFLVWCVNLYNFMDGADGLAGGAAVVGFGCYGAALWFSGATSAAVQNWIVAGAASGFLFFNLQPARIFMGDVGSITLGFLAGVWGIWGWLGEHWPAWFPLLVFSPLLVDASCTLLGRIFRGETFWRAHREHAYQRLVRMGVSHRRVALAYHVWMLAAGMAGLGLIGVPSLPPAIGWWLAAFVCLVALLVIAFVSRRWMRYSRDCR